MSRLEEIDKKYQELIEADELEKAYVLLDEELTTTYVPSPYYNNWKRALNKIRSLIKQKEQNLKIQKFITNLKISDLFKYILKEGRIDFNFLERYIQKFGNISNEKQVEILQSILNNSSIEQEDKFKLFIFITQYSKNNYEYVFYNSLVKEYKKIDVSTLAELNDFSNETNNLLNTFTNKDVTINALCSQLLNLFYLYYFPFLPTKILHLSIKQYVQNIYKFVLNSFENNNEENKEINKVLNYFENLKN